MKNKFSGKFIVLDGPDGCGKSTQADMLGEWIRAEGVEVAALRDPGGTVIGEKIRAILLSREHEIMDTRAELLLYMAARAQLWEEKIKPALDSGCCVLLDRWVSSTCAYQGYAGGFGIDGVARIADGSLERVWPDLTVILDVDLSTTRGRLDRELDRMEQKGDEYHQKVREGFLELAKGRGDIVVVDGGVSVDEVAGKIKDIIIETDF